MKIQLVSEMPTVTALAGCRLTITNDDFSSSINLHIGNSAFVIFPEIWTEMKGIKAYAIDVANGAKAVMCLFK